MLSPAVTVPARLEKRLSSEGHAVFSEAIAPPQPPQQGGAAEAPADPWGWAGDGALAPAAPASATRKAAAGLKPAAAAPPLQTGTADAEAEDLFGVLARSPKRASALNAAPPSPVRAGLASEQEHDLGGVGGLG